MAKTVKEYFKKTMEDTRRQHRKELEKARREGIQEGMRRQRNLLQRNMVYTPFTSKEVPKRLKISHLSLKNIEEYEASYERIA